MSQIPMFVFPPSTLAKNEIGGRIFAKWVRIMRGVTFTGGNHPHTGIAYDSRVQFIQHTEQVN